MVRTEERSPCNIRRHPYMSTNGPKILLLFTSILCSTVSSSPVPSSHFSGHSDLNTNLYNEERTFNVRIAAATCAAASMMASFVAFYWFCRMEKRFRHRLIMLLIYGDLMKAVWLFIFAIVSIARGTVFTTSSFCQASGFLVQYGMETSDYSVLVMAIHGAFQVFRPSTVAQNDGLYRFRHYIYAGAFIIPIVMSALAFINPEWGYMSQGAFCSLPLRPFWYRLALSWIPRYIVAIVILGLAVAIYAHVGFEFRSFSRIDNNKHSISTTTPIFSVGDLETAPVRESSQSSGSQARNERRSSSLLHDVVASRRPSTVQSLDGFIRAHHDSLELGGRSQSVPPVPPKSQLPSFMNQRSDLALLAFQTQSTRKSNEIASPDPSNSLTAIGSVVLSPDDDAPSPFSEAAGSPIQRHLTQQRSRIHRQLRLMFIYPIVYILMWVIPFINHCMTYSDYWAAYPLYWLSLLSTICVTLMGAVDCLVFSLRERPWRHIPHTDGTFIGSFVCWRRVENRKPRETRPSEALQRALTEVGSGPYGYFTPDVAVPETSKARASSSFPKFADMMPSVRTSRSSDQAKAAAGFARERLELEKEDRRAGWSTRMGTGNAINSRKRLDVIDSPEDEVERLDFVGAQQIASEEKREDAGSSSMNGGRVIVRVETQEESKTRN